MTLESRRLCNLYLLMLLVTAYLVVFVPRIGLENFRYDALFQAPPPTNAFQMKTAAPSPADNKTNVTMKTASQEKHKATTMMTATAETTMGTPSPASPSNPAMLNQTIDATMTLLSRNDTSINNDNNLDSAATNKARKLPRRHVALLGPHDRFNFGDLLFEKVVSNLLQERAGYLPEELHAVGLIAINMSNHGGHDHIISIPDALVLSHQAPKAWDIIYLGGEALGCNQACGVRMLPTAQQRQQANKAFSRVDNVTNNSHNNCAYLFPKQWLVRTNSHQNNPNDTAAELHGDNVAIINSPGVGGSMNRSKYPCMDALDQADYISFRDLNATTKQQHPYFPHAELRPDSAVLTARLFHQEIAEAAQRYLAPAGLLSKDRPYLAVQIKSSLSVPTQQIATILQEIQFHTNYTIVFFRAGSTWGHDSLDYYRNITQHWNNRSEEQNANASTVLFPTEHVWAVVALIHQAAAVLSTSLHVRIMAFIHERPRATWCSGAKHVHFVQLWEAVDHDESSCIMVGGGKIKRQTWPVLQASMVSSATTNHTQVAVERAIDSYLEGFDRWSKLLNRP